MPEIKSQVLIIDRCTHCQTSKPDMSQVTCVETRTGKWYTYQCASCQNIVLVKSWENKVTLLYPESKSLDESIPDRARGLLKEAIDSLDDPTGAIILTTSAVDAMLQAKDYKEGSLLKRIVQAANDHLITQEMALWAHEVRLDANEQRRTDEDLPLYTKEEAEQVINFAGALAESLFVLTG